MQYTKLVLSVTTRYRDPTGKMGPWVPGLFVPKAFRSQERIVPMGNFRSRDFLFQGTFVPWERKFPETFVPGPFRSWELSFPENESSLDLSFRGTFVPRTFRSQELSFLQLFYKALAMNADSYSNCQNLFRCRPNSVCFPKINWISLRCVRVAFFLLNNNAKSINVMMPVDKLTLIRPTLSILCAVTVIGTSKTDRRAAKAGRPTYNVSWEVHNGVNIIRVKSQPNMQ